MTTFESQHNKPLLFAPTENPENWSRLGSTPAHEVVPLTPKTLGSKTTRSSKYALPKSLFLKSAYPPDAKRKTPVVHMQYLVFDLGDCWYIIIFDATNVNAQTQF